MKKIAVYGVGVLLFLGIFLVPVAFGREVGGGRDNVSRIGERNLRPTPSISVPLPSAMALPTLPSIPTSLPTPKITINKPSLYQVPVLVLKYFPLDPNNLNQLDRNSVGGDLGNINLAYVRGSVMNLNTDLVAALETGSKGVLDYRIIEEKEYLKAVPVESGSGSRPADHLKILQGEGFNICDYVESRGVREVWVWMYHSNSAYPVESYQTGPYGGIGNGYMNLPVCKKTYTVYDYNYGRGMAMALEDHGHHIEILLNSIDSASYNKFVGGNTSPYGCGNTHCPPNVMSDCNNHQYDWENETVVQSSCGGKNTSVSCHSWSGKICTNDEGLKYKVWWMKNVPSSWWIWVGSYDWARANIGLRLN